MVMNLGDVVPNFEANTTVGPIQFHDWIGIGWVILFSHPADFTPVSTTELGQVNNEWERFAQKNVKLIALSIDDVASHKDWSKDVEVYYKTSDLKFPIIADPKRELAVQLGMIDQDNKDAAGLPLTCRAVFVIGPDYKLKLSMLYPVTTGINIDEIYRVVLSLQLTADKKVATQVNWKSGGECIVLPSVTKQELDTLFPNHHVVVVPSGKEYMIFTPDPSEKNETELN